MKSRLGEFLEEKAARKAEREESEDDGDLTEMISPDSLVLTEESDDGWRYSFQPQDEDDEGFMQYIDGELRIPKQGQYLETISMASRGAFKPRTGVKIKEFNMQMEFRGPQQMKGRLCRRKYRPGSWVRPSWWPRLTKVCR